MRVMRLLLGLILALTLTSVARSQSTAVSATITDAGGQAWLNGTYTFTTAALGQTPITGTLDGSGAFTSITFPHNSFTAAVGDVWTAKICPDATSGCYTKAVTISGATQSLSATLIPAAISLSIPFYPAAISTIRAYADAEITATPKGGAYYSTTSNAMRICTTVSGTTCTVWAASGGGGGASYGTGGGTAQAQTVTPTPTVSALTTGLEVCWLPIAANTAAAPTLTIAALTAKPITKYGTVALVANDITTTGIACVIYDGTEFQLQNPFAGVVARSSVQAVGTAAQAMNLYVSGGCDGISACTGNFWGIQAPASLAASLQYTGNLTDGSGNSSFVTDGSQHLSTVQLPQYVAGAGAVNVMTATYVPAFSAYAAGEEFDVLPNLANTTTNPTLNVSALGAKTITKCGTAVLALGDYSTTAVAKFIYDGTGMQLQNPQAAPCGGTSSLDYTAVSAVDEMYATSTASNLTSDMHFTSYDIAGTGSVAATASIANHPGVINITSGAAAGGNSSGLRILDNSAGSQTLYFLGTGGDFTSWETNIIFRADPGGVTNYGSYVGYQTITSAFAYAANGIGMYSDTTVHACTSGASSTANFVYRVASGGSDTCSDSGIAVVAGTWYRLDMQSTILGQVIFKLSTSGGAYSSPVTLSTNVPTTAQNPVMQALTRTTAGHTLSVDRWAFSGSGVAR